MMHFTCLTSFGDSRTVSARICGSADLVPETCQDCGSADSVSPRPARIADQANYGPLHPVRATRADLVSLRNLPAGQADHSPLISPVCDSEHDYWHSQADCAILIIDSTTGGFEAGISKDGQTREHALLAFTLGVRQMICCCKRWMPPLPSTQRQGTMKLSRKSHPISRRSGTTQKIPFVPISGFEGDNMIERSTNLDWYKGPTLLEALDLISEPKNHQTSPFDFHFRMCTRLVVLVPSLLDELRLMHHESLQEAFQVTMLDSTWKNVAVKDLKRGYVASNSKDDPAKEAAKLYRSGHHHDTTLARLDKDMLLFLTVTPPTLLRSGKELEKEPKFLKNDDSHQAHGCLRPSLSTPTWTICCEGHATDCCCCVIKSVEKKDPTGAKITKAAAKKNFWSSLLGIQSRIGCLTGGGDVTAYGVLVLRFGVES
ncbi:hypothetical protein Prudu_016187, partial [Prunus dulcis]